MKHTTARIVSQLGGKADDRAKKGKTRKEKHDNSPGAKRCDCTKNYATVEGRETKV